MIDKIPFLLLAGPMSKHQLAEKLGVETATQEYKLDRCLQKLKKDGAIHLVGERWALLQVKVCPACEGRGWIKQ
jgi:hypothetical protein